MHIPKRYGESRNQDCPFCGKQSITQNEQGIPTCLEHKNESLDGFKCICGEWLDVKFGKWGPYFHCMRCGNVSWSKGMEINQGKLEKRAESRPLDNKPREVTVTDKDVEFFL